MRPDANSCNSPSRDLTVAGTALRWRSADASTNDPSKGEPWLSGAVSKTACLVGFDPHAPCRPQQRDRQQRLLRQRGAVTARFTAPALA